MYKIGLCWKEHNIMNSIRFEGLESRSRNRTVMLTYVSVWRFMKSSVR